MTSRASSPESAHSSPADGQLRGSLMPIGGAEDKIAARTVLNRFVELCGGDRARLVVIPTASAFAAESGEQYQLLLNELGAAAVEVLQIETRAQANDANCSKIVKASTGVFMTGGDQVKLVALLGGTQVVKTIKARYAAGLSVGGTSAGASAISQHMIAFGRSGATPSQRMVNLAPGLGFTHSVIIDQHFRQRDRLGRLITAVAFNPGVLGVGLDEDTALVINADDTCEVVGTGGVTVVDGSALIHSDIYSAKGHGPIATLGVKVHILTDGYRFDLPSREPMLPLAPREPEVLPDDDLNEA